MPSRDEPSELQQLIDRYLAGEQGALDELIGHATLRLRVLTRTMLSRYPNIRRWEETDDVLQLAVIRLHKSLSEVRPETKQAFFGLAVTQIRRTLIDLARHYYGTYGHGKNYQSVAAGEDENREQILGRLASAGRPEDLNDWTAFHQAIENLPDQQREVLSLVWYGGLGHKEVAKLLEISERTVIRRLNGAKLSLSESLDTPPE